MNLRFFVFLISAIASYLLLLISLGIKIYLKSSGKTKTSELYEDLIIHHIRLIEDKYLVVKGRRYAYHPISNTVEMEEKGEYTLLDLFKIFHEISHADDYLSKYFHIAKTIYSCVCFPAYVLVMLFCDTPVNWKMNLSIFMVVLAVFKTFILYYNEKKASDKAFGALITLADMKDAELQRVRRNYIWAYRSQTMESMVFIPVITMILSVIY